MNWTRRSREPSITVQALDADGAASMMGDQAQKEVPPDVDAQVLVCRSARLTPAARLNQTR
jgi:hypothetical protein